MVGNSLILLSHSRKFRDSGSHLEKIWVFFFKIPLKEAEFKKKKLAGYSSKQRGAVSSFVEDSLFKFK